MTTIAQQIAALAKMTVAELVPRYVELFGAEPHCKNRRWLFRNCAWRLQEQALGGLPADAQARLEELIAEIRLPEPGATRPHTRRPGELLPGTVLTREWHGEQVTVRVADDGTFVLKGVPYGSLSAVAKAVTGQHWNGNLFFGITRRAAKEATT